VSPTTFQTDSNLLCKPVGSRSSSSRSSSRQSGSLESRMLFPKLPNPYHQIELPSFIAQFDANRFIYPPVVLLCSSYFGIQRASCWLWDLFFWYFYRAQGASDYSLCGRWSFERTSKKIDVKVQHGKQPFRLSGRLTIENLRSHASNTSPSSWPLNVYLTPIMVLLIGARSF
jgi:hypothetical protein